jgi:hypothetical protein
LPVREREGEEARSRKLDSFFIRERDDHAAIHGQTELLDDIAREKRHDSARVNQRFQFQAPDAATLQVAGIGENKVALVFENYSCANFSHEMSHSENITANLFYSEPPQKHRSQYPSVPLCLAVKYGQKPTAR